MLYNTTHPSGNIIISTFLIKIMILILIGDKIQVQIMDDMKSNICYFQKFTQVAKER